MMRVVFRMGRVSVCDAQLLGGAGGVAHPAAPEDLDHRERLSRDRYPLQCRPICGLTHSLSFILTALLFSSASIGYNSIRLPIGYWNIIEDPYERYTPKNVDTSLHYIGTRSMLQNFLAHLYSIFYSNFLLNQSNM